VVVSLAQPPIEVWNCIDDTKVMESVDKFMKEDVFPWVPILAVFVAKDIFFST